MGKRIKWCKRSSLDKLINKPGNDVWAFSDEHQRCKRRLFYQQKSIIDVEEQTPSLMLPDRDTQRLCKRNEILIKSLTWWCFNWSSHATIAFFCGKRVSQMATFLLSELWPAVGWQDKCIQWGNLWSTSISIKLPVATKLHDPRNMKSVMSLLWHSWVCGENKAQLSLVMFFLKLLRHSRRMIDCIVTQVQLAINSICHPRRQFRICFHVARIDTVWLTSKRKRA